MKSALTLSLETPDVRRRSIFVRLFASTSMILRSGIGPIA